VRYKAADLIFQNFEMEIEHLHHGMKLPESDKNQEDEIDMKLNQVDER